MAGHLELMTPAVDVEAGESTDVVVRVWNDGDGVEAFELEVTGEAAAWARVQPKLLAVPAGESVDATVSFEVPRGILGGTGEFGYRVRLSWAASVQGATADGVVQIVGRALITAVLHPRVASGALAATAHVDVRNDGSASTRVSVTGGGGDRVDDVDGVDVHAERESVVVDAGLSDSVKLRLRPRRRARVLRSRTLDYRVAVEPLNGATVTLGGTVRQRPLLAVVAPVLVVALLAGGLVAAAVVTSGGDGTTVIGEGATTTAPGTVTTSPPTTAPSAVTEPPEATDATDETVPPVPPEERRIAFQSARDGNFEIYTIEASGEGLRNVTNDPAHDAEPAWSPDGHRIAFDSDRDEGPGQFEIYVMNADGSDVTRVTNSPGPDGYPAWSPDGTEITFISFRDGNSEIYAMPIDGSEEARRLTRHPADDVQPAWSPDGETIVFASNRTGDYELWSMSASDGTGLQRLTDSPGPDMNPAWSPDGSRLAFDSSRDGDREIYVMDVDGGNVVRVTESPGNDVWPAWSADGSTIAFASSRDDGNEEIYTVPVGPGGAPIGPPTRVTVSEGADSEPAW